MKEHFIKKIKMEGPISISEYMADCLLSPKKGYYNLNNTIGKKGDFITSPEISQIFGELLGLMVVDYWHKSLKPKSPILVDLGGGNGTMLNDVLRTINQVDKNLIKIIQPIFIESSSKLIQKQKKTIPSSKSYKEISQIPEGFLMLIANEFFDALPIRQFIKINSRWHERLIDLDENNDLIFVYDDKPSKYEKILPSNLKNNKIIELCPTTINIISSLTTRIKQSGGILVIIDYAFNKTDIYGSLQAVKNHKYIDPLNDPGNSDLSSKVNFSIISDVARSLGAYVSGPIKQGKFLKNLGLDLRSQQLIKNNPNHKSKIIKDCNRLTSISEMGSLFEAIAITSTNIDKPSGF